MVKKKKIKYCDSDIVWLIVVSELQHNQNLSFLAGLHKVHPAYRMVNAGQAGGWGGRL
jgi:hypothetical protein